MHRSLALVSILVPSLVAALPAAAQIKPLRESPAASVSLDIGLTTVKIDYHRPAVRGRTIWGQLVPYGQVWRTGANEATVISFSDTVKITGREIPAGRYGFFAIPGPERWTLILSKQADIWGAYAYKESEDVLRFEATPEAAQTGEYLAYRIMPTGEEGARVVLEWAGLRVGFDIAVDVHANYKKLVLEAIAKTRPDNPKDWSVYLQAAQYYFKRDMELDQALAWADQSIKLTESFWNHELRARILERKGKRAEAIAAMQKAIQLSKLKPFGQGGPPKEYIDALEKDLMAWKTKKAR